MKAPGVEFQKLENKSWQDDFDGRTLNSLANYPSYPWRYVLKPASSFPCPIPGGPLPRLETSRREEVRMRYTNLWKEQPEVWESLLGTMLQEGVTIDNLLLNHQSEKAKVL